MPARRIAGRHVGGGHPEAVSLPPKRVERDQEEVAWCVDVGPTGSEDPELQRVGVRGGDEKDSAGLESLRSSLEHGPRARKMLEHVPEGDHPHWRQSGERLVGPIALDRPHADDVFEIGTAAVVHLDRGNVVARVGGGSCEQTEPCPDVDQRAVGCKGSE